MSEQCDPNITTDPPSARADLLRAADALVTSDHVSGSAGTEPLHPEADAPAGDRPVVPGYRVLHEIARGAPGGCG
jgi:hypothetical protein